MRLSELGLDAACVSWTFLRASCEATGRMMALGTVRAKNNISQCTMPSLPASRKRVSASTSAHVSCDPYIQVRRHRRTACDAESHRGTTEMYILPAFPMLASQFDLALSAQQLDEVTNPILMVKHRGDVYQASSRKGCAQSLRQTPAP